MLTKLPSIMTFVSATQFHVERPWGQRDYEPSDGPFLKHYWRLGVSGLLASALGLASFKNVFWSSERSPGNKFYYNCMEVTILDNTG